MKKNMIDLSKVSNVEIDGIDFADAMDFCNAYISSCDYDGRPATEDELDEINEDSYFVYDEVMKHIF